jgi:simple sugar transport system substrate-binding protein
MSAYGPAVGAPARAKADELKAAMGKGGFVIFKGGLKDNKGTVVVPAGKGLDQFDPELEKMAWLVEGVIGTIPG